MQFIQTVKNRFPNLKNIFEVGCHRGYDVFDIIKLWPDANVFAFEADPFNYQIAKNNLSELKNVHIYNLAVTDVTEKITFNRYHDVESIPDNQTKIGQNFQNTGMGSILKPGTGLKEIFKIQKTYQELEVQGISLYDFCKENKINTIDAMFMDVQGAEYKVFKGCKELLDTLKATIFEWSSTRYVLYENETDFNFIKMHLESIGLLEKEREYQFPGISGDSLFMRSE